MRKIKTHRGLVMELCRRETGKRKVDVANMTEIVSHLSDIVFEQESNEVDTYFYFMNALYDVGEKRAKKKAREDCNVTIKDFAGMATDNPISVILQEGQFMDDYKDDDFVVTLKEEKEMIKTKEELIDEIQHRVPEYNGVQVLDGVEDVIEAISDIFYEQNGAKLVEIFMGLGNKRANNK